MALAIMLSLAAVLTVVPIVAYARFAKRTSDRPAAPVTLSPAHGADFWAVERCIETGERSPNPRVRGLLREEIEWRRAQALPDKRALPGQWWVAMGAGYLALAAAVQRPEEMVFGAAYLAIGPILGRMQKGERATIEKLYEVALLANAD